MRNKLQLLRGMLSGNKAYNAPSYVSVDITRRCNLQCLFCPIHSPEIKGKFEGTSAVDDISLEIFETLCIELGKMGTRLVIIEGEGEPMLHKHVFDFISIVKKNKMEAMLLTNGTLLNHENAERLVDSDLDFLKVSLWSSSAQEYDQSHPDVNPAVFHKIIQGVKYIAEWKKEKSCKTPVIELYYILTSRNYKTLDRLGLLASEIGANAIWFSTLHDMSGKFSDLVVGLKDQEACFGALNKLKKQLASLSLEHNIDFIIQRYLMGEKAYLKMPCYAGWFYARIKMDGKIFPCFWNNSLMGDLNQSSFEKIWNASAYRAFRDKAGTKPGIAEIATGCDCNWCSHAVNTKKIYDIIKWFPGKR